VNPETSLAHVIREQLGLTGTKIGCGGAQCGACSVIMDGKVVRSCSTKMRRVPEGAAITTIEGIGTADNLHPVQVAWMVHGGAQCGFCSPGFIVICEGPVGRELQTHAGPGDGLVPETPQCLPLHGLPAFGRCGDGCGEGGPR